MSKEQIAEQKPLMDTYARFPVTLVRGKGSYVWDDQGEKYLDFSAGIAVCNLGHVPDAVKQALTQQLDNLWHVSNLYHIPQQEKLAALLVEHSCFDQVFFCNSGAEANEAAIKLARRYAQHVLGANKYEVVTFKQSFHGRTLGTLTATGQEKVQIGYQPLPKGFRYLPYNDMAALDELVKEETCAVLLELVQGEGGVTPADPEWIKALYTLCQENNILFMVDEIQTGMGRTGRLFAYEHYGIEPDVMTLAKGLGSGFPVGAMLAKKEVAKAFDHGSHGSTFGGNPLAMTAGLATVEYILQEGIIEHAAQVGEYLAEQLSALKAMFPEIKDVRGKGLMQGIVYPGKAADVVQEARKRRVLVLTAGTDVVRILPPLIITKQEVDQFISVMKEVFHSLTRDVNG